METWKKIKTSEEFRKKLISILNKKKNLSLNEIANTLIGEKATWKEKQNMLGRVRFHLNILLEKNKVTRKKEGRTTFWNAV